MEIIIKKAITAHNEGKLEEAENLYKEILKNLPQNSSVNYNMGILMNQLGKLDEAVVSYRKVIETKPDYAEAYQNLAIVLYKMGKIKEAEINLRKAVKLKPDYVEANHNLGSILEVLGNLKEAENSYKKAIELKPDYAEAYSNLAIVLDKMGKIKESEINLRKVVKLKPNNGNAHYKLGNTLRKLGKLNEAEISYKKAVEFKPDFNEAHNNFANLQYHKGDLLAAIDSFKQALNHKPDFTSTWYNIFFPLQSIKLQTFSIEKYIPLLDEQLATKHAQVAKSILSYRLNRGTLSTENFFNEAISIMSSVDSISVKNPKVSSSELITEPTPPKKITAMIHFGRSGTGFLHSLIDGHTEVSTLPSIYFSEFFDHSNWKKIIAGGWNEMADRFTKIYEVLFDASSTVKILTKSSQLIENIGRDEGMTNVGTGRDEILSVDKKVFVKELKQIMDCHDSLDAVAFFKLVHSAYERATQDHNKKKIIFYHIHNPDPYAQLNLLRLEPNTNWLMMVREPLQSCESWIMKDFHKNNYEKVANKIFQMLFEIDQAIFQNKNSIGVKLEDLKEHPKKTIPILCDWLGIKENSSLYQMTAQGKKWWGDPTSPDFIKEGMIPFGKSSINRKLGLIFSKNDQFILHTLFYPFSVRFGYTEENLEKFKDDLQAIRPMLDQMFDFEKKIVQNKKIDEESFVKSGPYLYLRSGLIERWNTLNNFHTYHNMLTPLKIN